MFDIITAGVIGFMLGGVFGSLIMAVCAAARRGDDQ